MKATLTRKIDRLFAEWSRPDSPGFSLAVIDNGKIAYKRGYGMASLEHRVPISTATVFDIGSTSKQFVAFCIAILAKKGKISLKDEVQKYITELPRYKRPVTIANLIYHTSGIRDYLTLMELAGMRFENEYPDEEIIGLIAKQRDLNFEPGREFLYSNSGYLLLGEIVKRVSGMSLRDYAEKHIFSPLGMKNTHFHDDASMIVANKATGYVMGNGGLKVAMSMFDAVGDGGVNTTVEDLFLWDRNFYRNRLAGGGRGLIDKITTPGELSDGSRLDYAYGLFVNSYKGMRMISHGGAWVGYRAEILRFPEKKFSVICLSNLGQANPTRIAKQIADICLGGERDGRGDKPLCAASGLEGLASVNIKKAAGFYRNPKTGGVVEILAEKGKLLFWNGWSACPLKQTGPSRFSSDAGALELNFPKRTAQGSLTLSIEKGAGKPEDYVQEPTIVVRAQSLKVFEGEYYCSELGTVYGIVPEKKGLGLVRKNTPKEHLRPVRENLFSGTGITLEFSGNRGGRCAGFELGAGRVKDLLFRRLAPRRPVSQGK